MSLTGVKCLGVIVVYDPLRAPAAIARFKEFIASSFLDYSVRVITNSPKVNGDIIGSNEFAEFSGWEEGVNYDDCSQFDTIIMANDTFCTRREFSAEKEKRMLDRLMAARSRGAFYLIGDLHWHINYRLILKKNRFILKWVRSDIFAISMDAFKIINGVALPKEKMEQLVQVDAYGDFVLSQEIPEVIRLRVESWLRPANPSLGWHGSKGASRTHLALKAQCVLQELYFTIRCVEAGVSIYSTAPVKKKYYLLNLLYKFQSFLR